MSNTKFRWLASAPFMLVATFPALAQQDTGLTVSAGYTLQTDSNLFRLPASANVQAQTGKSSAAEQIGVSTLGIAFNTTQSLQKFELDASVVDYRYQNFNYLSFNAINYNAAWRWAITPRFTGSVTVDRKETLNSFADYNGFNTRNQRTDTSNRLDTVFELDGPWRLLAGVGQTKQYNEQSLVAGGDYSSMYSNAGIRHQFASGSAITYMAKLASGRYLNRTLPSAGFFDDSFQQIDNDLRLRWILSGNSSAEFNITHINRSHPNYGQRDYAGFNTGASFNWLLSGKSSVAAGYSHTLDAYATSNSNYSQTDSIFIAPTWQVSPKIALQFRNNWAQRQYLGSPTATASSSRQDITRDTSINLSWQPATKLSLSTSLQNSTRGSNQAGLDFESTSLSLSAQLSF